MFVCFLLTFFSLRLQSILNDLDTRADTEMTRHQEEKERGLLEIQELEDQISQATRYKPNEKLNVILKKIQARDESVTRHSNQIKR